MTNSYKNKAINNEIQNLEDSLMKILYNYSPGFHNKHVIWNQNFKFIKHIQYGNMSKKLWYRIIHKIILKIIN